MSKLKAFADDNINATKKLIFVLGMVENIVGKEENVGHQHFLLFLLCFQNAVFSRSFRVRFKPPSHRAGPEILKMPCYSISGLIE